MSKIDQAREIVATTTDKATALQLIMEKLSVTKSNAFVYYTKCQSSSTLKTGEKRVGNQHVSKISMSSEAKKARKLKEIDKFLTDFKSGTSSVQGLYQHVGAVTNSVEAA